jgi:hypothetical protein
MAARTRTKDIHGVSVVQTEMQPGKWYTGVDGRVKIAEQADPAKVRREGAGYHVVSVQFVSIGDRMAYHCMVEYPAGSGVVKPGTDFIDTKDPSGVAKAETSAIGRALGLHGIANEESIASAEEMENVETQDPHASSQPGASNESTRQPAELAVRTADSAASDQQLKAIGKLCEALGKRHPQAPMNYAQARELIAQLSAEVQAARRGNSDDQQPVRLDQVQRQHARP